MRCNLLSCALAALLLSATARAVVTLPDATKAATDSAADGVTVDIHILHVGPYAEWQLSLPVAFDPPGNLDVDFGGHLPKIHSEGVEVWLSYLDDQGQVITTSPKLILPQYFNYQEYVPPGAKDLTLHARNPWDKLVVINNAQVILTPVPEPATLGLLMLGVVALVARRRG